MDDTTGSMKQNKRPIYLDLRRIRQPVTAVLSIGHRMSGILLFLCIPLLVYLLELSLRDGDSHARVAAFFSHGVVKIFSLLVLWGFAHHLFAGIRFMFIDVDVGVNKEAARRTAWMVMIGGLVVLILAAMVIL